jgi:hypothetical protein
MKINLNQLSYNMILIAAGLFFIGMLLGNYITGFVYAAAVGIWLAIIGLVIYIVSELMEKREEHG